VVVKAIVNVLAARVTVAGVFVRIFVRMSRLFRSLVCFLFRLVMWINGGALRVMLLL
jgi:hypothetical protein